MVPDALGYAADALRYWRERQQVVSHNLANADTQGFKAERVFARLVEDRLQAEAATDWSAGRLTPTGSPLDVAIEGTGFLVVDTPEGERWVRGGALSLDSGGRLVDATGAPVLGVGGPIVVPPGTVEIDARGVVRVDGAELGRLRLEAPAAATDLTRDAAGRYLPTADAVAVEEADARIRQGHLEESNVSPIEALVEMITVQRAYGAVQNSLRVMDGVMGTIANDLGKVV